MAIRAKIIGTGSYLPPRVVKNDDLKEFMDTSDEWIYSRSGIRERRYSEAGVNTSDLALEACKNAIQAAGIDPMEIDCLVFATLSPDMLLPGPGVFLQEKLGIAEGGCPCHEVRAQCSGFLYGTELAKLFIESGLHKNVLVVGAETMSAFMDLSTRGRAVSVLFGDGAGAVIYQAQETDREDDGVFFTENHADGRGGFDSIHTYGFDFSARPYIDYDVLDPEKNAKLYPVMANARGLFTNAVKKMSDIAMQSLGKFGFTIDDVDWFLAHQANAHILRDVADRVNLPEEKMLMNIHKYANTTAATIPLLLDEFVRNGQIKRGDLLVLTAFGVGYLWGCTLIRY